MLKQAAAHGRRRESCIAGIVLLCWGGYMLGKTPGEEKKLSSTLPPAATTILPVPTTIQPVLVECSAEAKVRPTSGFEFGERHRDGLGRLRAANGTNFDA
jgi:hypothetical protein